ncbi:unnamed protein product [Vitrella brassicaformis CCMP3155]|uniref:Uncharacterized protein n=1 Tax=Vitrella brassicaformis (strain CCMP3155) TaxID=1169540 RepID=A0A0G4H5D2_VITBC|nr:unnamed protein product [Vitrella brassicaformis CCMP3155]|eukprot:CEM38973.1 unnamed protein product [Vitrella brassicaformis CCMP3155]
MLNRLHVSLDAKERQCSAMAAERDHQRRLETPEAAYTQLKAKEAAWASERAALLDQLAELRWAFVKAYWDDHVNSTWVVSMEADLKAMEGQLRKVKVKSRLEGARREASWPTTWATSPEPSIRQARRFHTPMDQHHPLAGITRSLDADRRRRISLLTFCIRLSVSSPSSSLCWGFRSPTHPPSAPP